MRKGDGDWKGEMDVLSLQDYDPRTCTSAARANSARRHVDNIHDVMSRGDRGKLGEDVNRAL